MAASANPSGNHHHHHQEQSSFNGGPSASTSNGNSGSGHDNSGTASAMKHNPGISTDWSAEEQSTLENGLAQYASKSSIIRYAKIAMELPNKTVRDVALRARWMNRKEIGKRRKDDHSRKNKDKREKVIDSSSKSSQLHASRPGAHSYPMPTVSLDDEDGISYKNIGGETGKLLEQNKEMFQKIQNNFATYQPSYIQENLNLLYQARENLRKIMNSVSDTPEIMKQMPPLSVYVNDDMANMILPSTNHQNQS